MRAIRRGELGEGGGPIGVWVRNQSPQALVPGHRDLGAEGGEGGAVNRYTCNHCCENGGSSKGGHGQAHIDPGPKKKRLGLERRRGGGLRGATLVSLPDGRPFEKDTKGRIKQVRRKRGTEAWVAISRVRRFGGRRNPQ